MYDVEDSNYCEEWYQHYYTCNHCGEYFMVGLPRPFYCPACGIKIQSIKIGKTIISDFREEDK